MKYVVVTGGVVSGLGKGVTASSIGAVLQGCGLRVTSIKIDPYINTDAGTMSPYEHGEVYVLNDGGEVDLDLGNYERFLNITLTKDNNITTGKIFQSVIDRERHGDYLGKTVQVVPHVTDAVQDWIERVANIPVDGKEGPADVCVIELGGTVGDIESMHFVEALCQFQFRVGPDNFCLVHVSLIPVIGVVGEQKTKPTQHSVRQLRAAGLVPHLLACRSAHPLEQSTKDKLAQFCHVAPSHILNIHDVSNIWRIPLLLKDQDAQLAILNQLKLTAVPNPRLVEWRDRAECYDKLSHPVNIALVGKYAGFSDAYLSVMKAALHASIACSRKLNMKLVLASDLEKQTQETAPDVHAAAWETLKTVDGILVPGGFGSRGVEGKILAAKYAREAGIPFLGICLGMQVAVIEYCQSVLGLENSNSTEFDEATPHPCVISMLEHSTSRMGGTMRLGARRTYIQIPDSLTSRLYAEQLCFDEVKQQKYLDERHRHRYEVNPDLVERLEKAGLQFVGKDATGQRMEIIELPDHPFYVGVQFHPEFTSRPGHPSAPFLGLMLAASGQLDSYLHAARKTALPAEIAVHAGKKEPHQNGHVKEIYQNGHARELHQHGHAKEKYLSWFAKEAHQNGHIKNNGHAKEIGFAKENGHAQEIYRNELSRGRDDEPCSRSNVDELFAKQEVCNPLSSGHPQRIEEANEAPDDTHAEDRREVCHCSNGPSANDSAFCQLTPSFQNGHFKDTQSNGHGREHGGGCESGENGRRKDALQNGHRKEAVQRLSNGFQNGHGKNHVQNGPGSSSSEDEAEIYESEPGQELTHSVPVAAVHQGHHQNGQIRNGHHSRHALKHGGSKELSSQSKEAVQNELVLELFQNVWEEVVQNGRAMELQNGHGPAVGEQVKEMQNSLGKEAVPNGHGKESAPNGHLSLHMNGNSLTQNGHLNHRLNGSGLGINLVTDGVLV